MDRELRIDEGEIKDWRFDEEEEVLVADVLMTKSQVLPYKEDRETVWELLPPDELSEDEWLESAKSKAVTDLHPDEEVNYENLGEHSRGSLTNKVWTEEKDDGTVEVWAKETVYDPDLIQEIKDGQKEQVSIGRFVEVVDESGEFNGTTYDRKQTNFRLNHLAHVPQGRAGSDVSVRLDGGGTMVKLKGDEVHTPSYNGTEDKDWSAISKDFAAFKSAFDIETDKSWDELTENQKSKIQDCHIRISDENFSDNGYPVTNPFTGKLNRGAVANAKSRSSGAGHGEVESVANKLWDEEFAEEEEGDSKPDEIAIPDEVRDMKLTIGDKELELDEELSEDTVEEFQDEIDERLHELRKKDDKLDSKDEKLGKLEGRLDSLEDKVNKNVTEDKINEKLALIEDVKEVMPDYNWKGKSSTEMKADVVDAVFDGVDLEDKSEAYINGRFDSAMEKAKDEQGKKMAIKPDREEDEVQSRIDELKKQRVEKFQG
ncbi:MAG: DUF2213 domain-containing protein [Clostridiales bacterium]|nr:DUF2213 domain-containing protein [Clostridiales bacterium]